MSVVIRPLREADLDRADRIMRVAFGTFVGLPKPEAFGGDAEFVRPRWRARPDASVALEVDGVLAGSNHATRWGSFGFFGPLSIHPDYWDRGYASALMEPILETFDAWQLSQAGLFTFPHSPKHIGLYQKFGFRTQALNLVLGRPVPETPTPQTNPRRYSELAPRDRGPHRAALQALCDEVLAGFDPSPEIESIASGGLGDTLSVWRGERPVAFACAHAGAGSEAGSASCSIRLGVVEAGPSAERDLQRILEACEALARERGVSRLQAGVNTANAALYEGMLRAGFRIDLTGISMQRPNRPGFCDPAFWVFGDWR